MGIRLKLKQKLSLILAIIMTFLFSQSSTTFSIEAEKIEKPNLEIGDYIQFGMYKGEHILWRVIDIDEDGDPMLFSDKILSLKSINTIGEKVDDWGVYDSLRKTGSSYWKNSNLRQWLNSSEEKVIYDYNTPLYHGESGFLSDENFTQEERNFIKTSANKLIINNTMVVQETPEGGSEPYHSFFSDIREVVDNYDEAFYITVMDKVFLLSTKEIHENVWENRSILGDEYYMGELSKTAVANSPYDSKKLIEGNRWFTTLRTQSDLTSNRSVHPDGTISSTMAAEGYYGGIRPALRLSSPQFTKGAGEKDRPYIIKGGIELATNHSSKIISNENSMHEVQKSTMGSNNLAV